MLLSVRSTRTPSARLSSALRSGEQSSTTTISLRSNPAFMSPRRQSPISDSARKTGMTTDMLGASAPRRPYPSVDGARVTASVDITLSARTLNHAGVLPDGDASSYRQPADG